MQTINIICIGKIKEKYWTDAISEYKKRLFSFCKFNIIELAEEKTFDNPNPSRIEAILAAEGKRLLSKIGAGDYVIAMCVEGKLLSSPELARKISDVGLSGRSTVDFVIGGSWGLSDEVKQRADFKLSMSKMTFPHQMARVVLCEQIYRAFEINNNGKYHK
ncbi:MAG: 23S rRNA (pseudouridine(1915)-N(3))-methyltransferase RlmH [Ruminococcus sp.]|nr:23S rRNA (pseudouridine(1915)-N(3))-methyltransferase RlmH [Ruminococcus sp.]